MKLLSLEHLLQLHAFIVQSTGGTAGLRDLGRLEAAISTQTQNVFGQELYDGALEKAAALIRGIIADHPFVDGNKRTGMLAGLTFLKLNDITTNLIKGELEDFAVKIAVERLDVKAISIWLEQHSSLAETSK